MNSAVGFVCIAGVVLSVILQKQKLSSSEEARMYQAWVGTFQDSLSSVVIRMIRKKKTTMEKNQAWLSSSGEDASVITRNFYLGNSDPNFDWKISQEGLTHVAVAEEIIVDGWNSVVQICIEIRLQENRSEEDIAKLFKTIVNDKKLHWKKTLI